MAACFALLGTGLGEKALWMKRNWGVGRGGHGSAVTLRCMMRGERGCVLCFVAARVSVVYQAVGGLVAELLAKELNHHCVFVWMKT